MGVKGLLKILQNNFASALSPVSSKRYHTSAVSYHFHLELFDKQYQHLFVDLNCLLRNGLRKKIFTSNLTASSESVAATLFPLVDNHIEDLILSVKPQESVHLCLDGAAPAQKLLKQRKSRAALPPIWHQQLQITPGTRLMKLYHHHANAVHSPLLLRKYKNISKVHFSSSNVPGEGELKVFNNLVRSNHEPNSEKYDNAVYGNDSDLVLYSIGSLTHNSDVILWDSYEDHAKFDLRQFCTLLKEIGEVNRVRLDFVLINLMNGSDYTKKIGSDRADSVWTNYLLVRQKEPHSYIVEYNNGSYHLNIDTLVKCMPSSVYARTRPDGMVDRVLTYFRQLIWSFYMCTRAECMNTWFLPSLDTMYPPTVSEVVAVHKKLGHDEFNAQIQPNQQSDFQECMKKASLRPHEVCSAVSPVGRREFVPPSIQDEPCLQQFLSERHRTELDVNLLSEYLERINRSYEPSFQDWEETEKEQVLDRKC